MTTPTEQRARDDAHLAELKAGVRRVTAQAGLSTNPDVYGAHCTNCGETLWCLPADKATCAHTSICEDCWPNGCTFCETEVEEGIRRREDATNRILSAALELPMHADDLAKTDLRKVGWINANDLRLDVALTIESLRRVEDVLRAQTAGTKR